MQTALVWEAVRVERLTPAAGVAGALALSTLARLAALAACREGTALLLTQLQGGLTGWGSRRPGGVAARSSLGEFAGPSIRYSRAEKREPHPHSLRHRRRLQASAGAQTLTL